MAKTVCRIVGVGLLVVGLAGFASPTLLGLHLTTIHDIVHLLTGLVALYVGFAATRTTARLFCLLFGGAYLLLALAGLVAPGLVSSVLGHTPLSVRELTPDNAVHAVLGVVLLAASKKS
jgi:predicted small integral membrane protein